MFDPALPLSPRRARLSPEEALAAQIRMVLETLPGQLPWRPDFGCSLSDLVGQPATGQALSRARVHIEEALRRWLPEVTVARCQVRVVTRLGAPERPREVPLAEAAIIPLGTHAELAIDLDLETALGAVALQALISP